MRHRRTLIDAYLRAHDPVPRVTAADAPPASPATEVQLAGTAAEAERASTARRTTSPPTHASSRRPRRRGLPALAAATTMAAIAVVAFMPGRATHTTDAFLSPEAAVAAASADLERDGILHWSIRPHRLAPGAGATTPPPATSGSAAGKGPEHWLDLKTHATAVVLPPNAPGASGVHPERTWYNGRRTYRALWPARPGARDPRPVLVRTVRRRGEAIPEATQTSPIEKLRALLAAAARGDALLADAAPVNGVPVVRVTKRERTDDGLKTTRTWMTRESPPRPLRVQETFKFSRKKLAEVSPRVRRDMLTWGGIDTTFDGWQLLPRTPENLAKVAPPDFDPAKVRVVTQFLGPRKR